MPPRHSGWFASIIRFIAAYASGNSSLADVMLKAISWCITDHKYIK
jgi:hypothetical protein